MISDQIKSAYYSSLVTHHWLLFLEDEELLAIKLMRMGAKKSPAYRIVVKEKSSKRDGAYVEKVGFYDPTRNPAEVRLDLERVKYWLERGAQPTDTVRRLIRKQSREQTAPQADQGASATAPAA